MSTELPLPASISEARLHSLVSFALEEEGADGYWEISLLFTTDARIREMHRQFMNLNSPTDIMTFPYEPHDLPPHQLAGRGGDIVISVETAAMNAEEGNWSLADELLFLTLHGVLHILGWDDTEPGQRAGMLGRQSSLLERWRRYAGDETG